MKENETAKKNRKKAASMLAFYRLQKGMTQSELAKVIGTTTSGISRIESGNQNISLDMYYSIADALGKEPMILMEDVVPYMAETREYSLRLYDEELLSFSMQKDVGLTIKIEDNNEEKKICSPWIWNFPTKGCFVGCLEE